MIFGAAVILTESFSILQMAMLILGIVGLLWSANEMANARVGWIVYIMNPTGENAEKIIDMVMMHLV